MKHIDSKHKPIEAEISQIISENASPIPYKVIAFIIIFTMAAVLGWFLRGHIHLNEIKMLVEKQGMLGPLVFMGVYILAVVLMLPAIPFTLLGGLIFGPIHGAIYSINASVLGATISFLLARHMMASWVRMRLGDSRIHEFIVGVEENGWKFVAVVRLIVFLPFGLINYVLGLTNVSLIGYIGASYVFMLPECFAYTYLGSLGEEVMHGNYRGASYKIFISLGILFLLAISPLLIKLWSSVRDKEHKK